MSNSSVTPNHMDICWHGYTDHAKNTSVSQARLAEKASLIGRAGLMLLSCGTGAWRVRSSMNTLAQELGIICNANIGLLSIDYTCFDGKDSITHSLSITSTGVNTSKLNRMERFIRDFTRFGKQMTVGQLHSQLDEIDKIHSHYSPLMQGLASAMACCAFCFLLGGGPVEMICTFLGAGTGNYLRAKLTRRHYTLFLCAASSVALACLVYTGSLQLLQTFFSVSSRHEAGYVCAMLFIIPGFPFITSGIDFAKQDMRSGIERLAYAVMIITVATVTAWAMALLLDLRPTEFPSYVLPHVLLFFLRLAASFCGVFGFSVMFNSPLPLAAFAAGIGMVVNTLRLELVDLLACPPAAAAFLGALTAGLLASLVQNPLGYPRISITVPSVVIMVPGLYLYRAVYNLGIMSLNASASWMASALLIILALPLGLVFARILTDRSFRHCS